MCSKGVCWWGRWVEMGEGREYRRGEGVMMADILSMLYRPW